MLFSGTLRSNLDPFDQYEDARLYDAMKRACLVDERLERTDVETGEMLPPKRFALDTVIDDEGLNLSVGERSLVSLARALVKDVGLETVRVKCMLTLLVKDCCTG